MNSRIAYRFLFILFLVSFLSQSLDAQDVIFEVEHLTMADGFPNRYCSHIAMDDRGIIWTSTKNQLIKYNGYEYEKYDFANSNLIKGEIEGLHFVDGELYIFQLDEQTGIEKRNTKFKIFLFDFANNKPVNYDYNIEWNLEFIKYFCVRNNKLFVVNEDNELINISDKKVISKTSIPKYDFLVNINKDGLVFYMVDNTLIKYDLVTNESKILIENFFKYFDEWHVDSEGNLHISGDENAFDFEANKHLYIYKYIKNFKTVTLKQQLKYLSRIKKNPTNETMITDESLDMMDDGFLSALDLPSMEIFNSISGSKGTICAATDNGMLLIRPRETKFKKIATNETQINGTRDAIFSDDLVIYKKINNSVADEIIESPSGRFNADFIKQDERAHSVIEYYQDEDNESLVWSTGWFYQKLRLIDFKNRKVTFPGIGKVANSNLFGILKSKYSKRIFTNSRTHLYYVEDSILKEDLNWNNFVSKTEYKILDIFQGKNKLWIGTSNGPLSYDERTGEILRDPIFDKVPDVIVSWMHIDKHDESVIWIGTQLEGLLKWDIEEGSLHRYGKEDGLQDLTVHSIYEDNQNRLWIPTNKYLHCLNKETNHFSIFSEENGISNNEFNRFGFSENADNGEIILASLNGYTVFNPDSISTDIKDDYELNFLYGKTRDENNQERNLTFEALNKRQIVVDSDRSSIELGFGLNPIMNAKLNNFYFRLNDENGEWKELTSNKINLYTIPYGTNVLEIQANINQPNHISDILSVEIELKKPFHKTNTIWYLGTFLLLGLSWLFWSLRLSVITRRNKRLEVEIDNRTKDLQEANAKRQKLFTILSHDLRAPFSSLSNITKKLRFLEKNNRMDEFHDLALDTENRVNALSDNLSNVLLWATKETNAIQVSNTKMNLYSELNLLIELYASDASDLGIDIVNSVEKELSLNFDKTVFQTILRNALQNAVKYSATNSAVEITSKSLNKELLLTVKNEYVDELKSKKVDSTGVGLQITEELAKLTNSKVELNVNEKGKTYFNFYIPDEKL